MSAILMTEEYWANSPLSIARYTGVIKYDRVEYIIVNKDGLDIFACSAIAHRQGKEKAIEPGEPCDLVDRRYVPIYHKIGRDKFIEWVKEGLELKQMKERIKQEEVRGNKPCAKEQSLF